MAFIKEDKNEHGVKRSHHVCDVCGVDYTLTPGTNKGTLSKVCMGDDCASYDPDCDVELFFMSDQQISDEKKVVSMGLLRKRKNGDLPVRDNQRPKGNSHE